MRRALVLILSLGLLPASVSPAEAVTVREIIELTRAGLGDEVLLALIEVDGGVFAIDAATLKSLRDAGVSERVIVALVRSGRQRPVVDPAQYVPPPPPEPQVIVIEHERPVVYAVPVPVAVPVYVTVPVRRSPRTVVPSAHPPLIPPSGFGVPLPVTVPASRETAEPVYWGWGGKRRPDAWKEDPGSRK